MPFANTITKSNDYSPAQLMIFIRSACGMECSHCGTFENNLGVSQELTPQDYREIAQQAKEVGIKTSTLCGGGELMLNPNQTLRIIKELSKENIDTGIVTNGSWAVSKIETRSWVDEFKRVGLNRISLSFDAYHEEYTETDDATDIPVNIIRVIDETEISLRLQVVDGANAKDRNTELLKQIASRLRGSFNQTQFPAKIQGPEYSDIEVHRAPLQNSGKGNTMPDSNFDFMATSEVLNKHCERPNLTIHPDGTFTPCCNYEALNEVENYTVGCFPEDSVHEVISNVANIPYFAKIMTEDMRAGLEVLEEKPDISEEKINNIYNRLNEQNIASYCEVCGIIRDETQS